MIESARARVDGWKQSLIETGGSMPDPLLDVRDGASCVAVPGVDPVRLAQALAGGSGFAFEAGCDPALDLGWLRVPLPSPELAQRLLAIHRAGRAALADAGEHVVWIALGLLTWTDVAGIARTAPLALWPARLERGEGGTFRIEAASELAPRINLALVEALRRDFALVLESARPLDAEAVAALLDTAEGIAVTRPGWHVERVVKLGVFSLARWILARDLAELADERFAAGVVGHLAAVGSAAARPFAQPSIAAAEAVTRPSASPELLAPLDADASQLAAVAATAAGASFVLHAAPGTGASQTIANAIAHCIGHGKSVLLVASRPAALEAVYQRLATVGLGEFCLDLGSPSTRPAAVLAKLGRVVERAFRPGAGPTGDDARLAELRAALDAHVAALHRVGPFGRSLHAVLGRLVELRTTPCAALAEGDAVGLDRATYERRLHAVEQLARAAIPVEPVAGHPWRQSTLDRWPADGRARARAALDEAAAASVLLAAAIDEVGELVPGLVARTRAQLAALGALAERCAATPRPGAELLTHVRTSRADELAERIALIRARGAGSVEVPRDPLTYLALAHRHRALVLEVEERFTEAAADLDAHALWTQLRKWTHSVGPLRFVALRAARHDVRAAARAGQLETDESMISALEAVIAEGACRAALLGAAEPARRWFGELVATGVGTVGELRALDLSRLDTAVGWAGELRKAFDAVDVAGGEPGRAAAWRALVAQVAAGTDGADGGLEAAPFGRLAAAVARWAPALEDLAAAIGIAADTLAAGDDHLATLRDRVDTLRHAIDSLDAWVAFHLARRTALEVGVGPAIGAIERGDLGAEELAPAWERATLLAWADAELADTPALARFHGAAHHAQVAAFADLDRGALALARARALVRLAERVPRAVTPHDPTPREPDVELELLLGELRRPPGAPARPLRELLAGLPTVLPRIAPCVIATPLAVATLLDPALPRFDVVVIDEASCLPTAEAIGALARGTSAVVVGDGAQAIEADSVLETCLAARLPELQLAWHYRCKHEDLIAFANQRYYADRLQVLPAPGASSDLGVAWRKVEVGTDGERERAEAEAVVAEVLARLRDPAQRTRSIGIVTLTRDHAVRIEDLLDAARAGDPAIDAFVEPAGGGDAAIGFEPLWVKPVDAVHGATRDVIVLALGAGPEAPLLAALSPRRLAAAITRAREQLVVVSTFGADELPDTTPALRDLRAFLAFVQAGGGAAHPAEDTSPASPLLDAIGRALTERGWTVRHRVGTGSYKIDLAVVDPNDPERYVLAIEDDGAAYASAPAARDRDRLRPQLLAQLGWRVHRIWGLDWWTDPEREIQRAHGAIVTAIAASRQRRAPAPVARPRSTPRASRPPVGLAAGSTPVVRIPPRSSPVGVGAPRATIVTTVDGQLAVGSGPNDATPLAALQDVTTTTRVRLARGAIAIGPYAAAAIPNGRRTPDDLFAPRHLAELGKVIEQVLAAEAPIHVDLLARRVGGYFGIGRVTQRVTEQVRAAVDGRGRWGDEQDVVWRLDQDPASVPAVRVTGQGPAARRQIAEVPLSELAAAARIVVERAASIGPAELVRDAARLLGFARITDQVTTRVALGVQHAISRELIRLADGRAVLPAD